MKKTSSLIFISALFLSIAANGQNWSEKNNGSVSIVTNKGGQTLGYSGSVRC